MAAPAGSRLRLVCSNCTTLCEVSIPASATQKPVRYQVRCPNCKTVNDPQIARTTNGVAEVVGPNSSAKRKASPTVRAYASPLCAFRAHAPRSLAAQNGPPAKRSSPTPQPKQPRPPSNGAGSSSDVKPEPEPPSGPRVDEILQMRPAARGGTEYLVKWRPEEGASAARPDSWETQSGLDQKAISAFHARQSNGNGAAYRSLSAVDERSPKSRCAALAAAAPAAARPRAPAADARGAHKQQTGEAAEFERQGEDGEAGERDRRRRPRRV